MNTMKHETHNGKCSGIMKKGDDFDNKEHCMYVIGKKSLDEGFEFKYALPTATLLTAALPVFNMSHLKGTYKGTNLVFVGMDGNNQIIPIATGVSQGETGESWTWFLLKLKECIAVGMNHEALICPDGLQVVKPPNMNFRTAGKPKNTDRIKSQGEEPIQEYEAAYTNNYVRSQEYEASYISNNYVRSQEYEAAYIFNNYVRSQEYEANYTNNYVMSQEYRAAYNSMGSQEYGAAYNSMDGRSQDPNPTMPNLFSQFNLGQSSQQTYSTWDSTWDHVNLVDP
ncbi:transposase, MuDR, MULE transposase domain protein [Tanacetum coccineum]